MRYSRARGRAYLTRNPLSAGYRLPGAGRTYPPDTRKAPEAPAGCFAFAWTIGGWPNLMTTAADLEAASQSPGIMLGNASTAHDGA
jgi:hypothetical protein